jgi:hypothetical protein
MTFRQIISTRCDAGDVLPAAGNQELTRMPAHVIRKYRVAAGHFDHGIFSALEPATLRFTILREPVSRYVAAVSHMMRDPAFSTLHEELKGLSIDEAMLHPRVTTQMRNSVVKIFCHDELPVDLRSDDEVSAAQARRDMICADLSLAIEHLDSYQVVGIQERYADSVQLMLLKAGLPPMKLPPLINNDPTGRQSQVSPRVLNEVRGFLDLEVQMYEYALRRMDEELSEAIYSLATNKYASGLDPVPDSYKVDLFRLPGSYGWYAAEPDGNGSVRIWGGSRDEQGFVLKVKPSSRYLVVLNLHARGKDKQVTVTCNIPGARVQYGQFGVVLQVEDTGTSEVLDVAIRYPGAQIPKESGTGEDLRRLGVLLLNVGVFRVESFDQFDIARCLRALRNSPAGPIKLPSEDPAESADQS